MPNYIDYLNATLPARQADLAARREQFAALQQQLATNASAPVVSGSGGSMPAAQQNLGLTSAFKTSGSKSSPIAGRMSQGYGASRIKYAAGRHTGFDFGVGVGTTVRSAANGIVTRVGREGAYGNSVHVRHPDGFTTVYAHLNNSNVRLGQNVKSGQAIAKSGNTGRSTGAHLHFEVRSRDKYGGDVNPASWLKR